MQFLIPALLLGSSSIASACLYPRSSSSNATVFSYTGQTGPLLWHTLSPENSACKTGTDQSPIDVTVSNSKVTLNSSLVYPSCGRFTLLNNGHTLQLIPAEEEASRYNAVLDGDHYSLLQMHFHTPSEHRWEDEGFPLEVHLVHESSATKSLAVVGIFFDFQPPSPGAELLQNIVPNLPYATEKESETNVNSLLLTALAEHFKSSEVRHYAGSLTTPPCSEGVSWYVVKEPLAVTVEQYKAVKGIMKFNSRFTQGEPATKNLLGDACTM